MPTSLVLTVVGRDRPGVVSALSEKAASLGANWLESRMAHLAGQFAGIVHLQVPDAQADALTRALGELQAAGLQVSVTRAGGPSAPAPGRLLTLDLIGQDKPGIVRDVTRVLAARGVSIEELESDCVSGAMSGETMFRAQARLRVPEGVPTDELRTLLESLGNELLVDVHLDESRGA